MRLIGTLLILVVTISTPVVAKRITCYPKKYPLLELIDKFKKLQGTSSPFVHNVDLATLYMIASIHESYTICQPLGPKSHLQWGRFIPPDENMKQKIIFWDGEITGKEFLLKALNILKEEPSQYEAGRNYDNFKMGWIYEKLGETDKAIAIYNETYKVESKKIANSLDCRLKQCNELMATVESLQFLSRIYDKVGEVKKKEELVNLIKKFEKQRVRNHALL